MAFLCVTLLVAGIEIKLSLLTGRYWKSYDSFNVSNDVGQQMNL